ncbi:MAG: shikimate dehydrogenase [Bacteroidales bacterium]|nr:shikimate dehydrogenase [Bacteroidales bacterium]
MKLFGLIGHPLGHSFSKAYFTEKFESKGLDCEYQNFDIKEINTIRKLVSDHPNLKGFNVTIPYKEAIIPYLDELDPVANKIGAANTVKVLSNGRLKGFNTDVTGMKASITMDKSKKALILGTGGASKAAQYVLRSESIPFHLVSRDPKKSDFTYQNLTPEIIQSHLIIVNATPVGMAPHANEAPDIPYEAITPQHMLFDLIYNPEETLFLQHGRKHGATTVNGLTMLHAQAEASWMIWNQP